jgi:hypothetical protein
MRAERRRQTAVLQSALRARKAFTHRVLAKGRFELPTNPERFRGCSTAVDDTASLGFSLLSTFVDSSSVASSLAASKVSFPR